MSWCWCCWNCSSGGGIHQTSPKGGREIQGRNQLLTHEKLPPPKSNITLDEQKAIREFKEDQSRVVLTADKDEAMVVMDREDYIDKAQLLLTDTNMYKPITKDPTNKLKNKLSQTLRDIKNQGGLNEHIYRKV